MAGNYTSFPPSSVMHRDAYRGTVQGTFQRPTSTRLLVSVENSSRPSLSHTSQPILPRATPSRMSSENNVVLPSRSGFAFPTSSRLTMSLSKPLHSSSIVPLGGSNPFSSRGQVGPLPTGILSNTMSMDSQMDSPMNPRMSTLPGSSVIATPFSPTSLMTSIPPATSRSMSPQIMPSSIVSISSPISSQINKASSIPFVSASKSILAPMQTSSQISTAISNQPSFRPSFEPTKVITRGRNLPIPDKIRVRKVSGMYTPTPRTYNSEPDPKVVMPIIEITLATPRRREGDFEHVETYSASSEQAHDLIEAGKLGSQFVDHFKSLTPQQRSFHLMELIPFPYLVNPEQYEMAIQIYENNQNYYKQQSPLNVAGLQQLEKWFLKITPEYPGRTASALQMNFWASEIDHKLTERVSHVCDVDLIDAARIAPNDEEMMAVFKEIARWKKQYCS